MKRLISIVVMVAVTLLMVELSFAGLGGQAGPGAEQEQQDPRQAPPGGRRRHPTCRHRTVRRGLAPPRLSGYPAPGCGSRLVHRRHQNFPKRPCGRTRTTTR